MHIAGLTIYPVKALQGISLQEAEVTPMGLKWDRFWMVTNENGLFMTQRNLPQMATIKTHITDTHLVLSHPEYEDLTIALENQSSNSRPVTVWKSHCQGVDEGAEASEWLTAVLGTFRNQNLHLVRMAPSFQRLISDTHTEQENATYFADGYPFLVVAKSSLTALNTQLNKLGYKQVPMERFRGNIVLDNSESFAEHHHKYLFLTPELSLHLCKPCERCKVITLDQKTGESFEPQQPLKTLFSMDNVKQKGAFFGQNAVLSKLSDSECKSTICVGDEVFFQLPESE